MTQHLSAGFLSNLVISGIFISALFLTISKAEFISLNGAIFVLVAGIYIAILYQINTSKVTITSEHLLIDGLIWSYSTSKDDVISVEIVDNLSSDDKPKYRKNGVSIFRYKAGKFTLNSGSSAFMLTNGQGKYAVVTLKDSSYDKIIFNLDEMNIATTPSWFHG